MGCGSSSSRVADGLGGMSEDQLMRRTSDVGELRSFGSSDSENLKLLESAEAEGVRRGARGRATSEDQPAQLILVGAHNVGKTTLLRTMLHAFQGERVRLSP